MLKNYILIALRNIQRNSVYSFINIAGLSIGLACSILILLWVADEISFDRFHKNFERIHHVYISQEISSTIETTPNTPYPMLDALKSRSSQIKRGALINHGEGYLLGVGDIKVIRMGTVATEEFLSIFDFQILSGSKKHALTDPSSIVLTRSTAKALFGSDDAMNKIVKLENKHELKVSAVIEDVPAQSTLQFDFLLPFGFYSATQEWVRWSMTAWKNHSFKTFVELSPGASAEEVNNSIRDLIKENNESAPTAKVFLHPMERWHLYSEFENGKEAGGMIEYVRMFTVIGIFILAIACINFMNLATARSESRAREVGIRKSVGSRRKQLVAQFIGESLFISFIAFLFAIVLVEVTLPFFNLVVNKTLQINYADPVLWLAASTIVLLTGVVSGSYPAFYLSAFKPVEVLKGKLHAGRSSIAPRKILVTLQFGFSIFLIIATIVIYQQLNHVKSRHVGYDRENLMLIWTSSAIETNYSSLKEELKNSGIVKSVCKSSAPITRIFSSTDEVRWPGKVGHDKVGFITFATEYDFTETMGIKLLEGRDFSPQFTADTSAVIINKAALNVMGLHDPIGQKITMWGNERTIIGVMEDVVMGSPYQPADPLAVVLIPGWSSTISVRLNPSNDLQASVAAVEKIFKIYDPDHPLSYRFADTEFETKFRSINLISQLASAFAILAVAISCLGLFGLAAFTAEQRTKEVCIRKILGASVGSLVVLMSKDFSRLVIFAFIIASPLAWWMLGSYLEQYPYRITLQWWILPIAGLAALVLTVLIVSTQALRAARSNPANNLKAE
jgi:putative ABC transport system permease protein